jgi:hypothetical protein
METLASYLLKVNIVFSGLYFFYYALCRSHKLLVYNRIFLLGTILSCVMLPFVPFAEDIGISDRIPALFDLHKVGTNSTSILNGQVFEANALSRSFVTSLLPDGLSLTSILLYLYLFMMLVLAFRLILRLLHVRKIIKRSSKLRKAGLVYCDVRKELTPCSFFNHIIINKRQFSSDEYALIMKHEEAHCKQWHSVDVLLGECLHIALWINPFLLSFKKSLKLNLEYLADEAVLASGIHPIRYQYQILAKVKKDRPLSLMNALRSSKIKQRIMMMNTLSSNKIHVIKHLIAIPFLFCLYVVIQLADGSHRYSNNHTLSALYDKLTGYYQYIGAKHVLIRILNENGKLVLEQLWDNETISFEQVRDLNFYNTSKKFPLKFIESTDGRIAQILAFEKDVWNKVDDYKTVVKQEVTLPPENLKQLEGYYRYQGEDKYLKITAARNRIVLNESWTGNTITLFPESSTLFFSKQGNFPLEFIRNKQGAVVKAIAFHKDFWHKLTTEPN